MGDVVVGGHLGLSDREMIEFSILAEVRLDILQEGSAGAGCPHVP